MTTRPPDDHFTSIRSSRACNTVDAPAVVESAAHGTLIMNTHQSMTEAQKQIVSYETEA